MKKLFIIVAALFVAVSFSACSDDDEGGGKAPTKIRYVKSIVDDNGSFVQFDYDQQNRIIKYEYNDHRDGSTDLFTLTYNGDVVEIKEKKGPNFATTIRLNADNNATSAFTYVEGNKSTTINYTYDKGNLIRSENNDGFIYAYKWLNGNRYYDGENSVNPDSDKPNFPILTYSKYYTPKCNIDLTNFYFSGFVSPQSFFLGNHSANLPESEITYYEEQGKDGFKYSYEFDKDGYISKVTVTDFVHVDGYNDETTCNYTITYY